MRYNLSYPKQTVLITTRANINIFGRDIEKDNIMTCSWHTMLSFDPFLYAVLISPKRFTHQLIDRAKIFCINFISQDMKELAIKCGTHTGKVVDKFRSFYIEKEECEKIDCPYLKDASAVFECRVISSIKLGDHTLFVGHVLKSKQLNKKKRLFQLGHEQFTTTL